MPYARLIDRLVYGSVLFGLLCGAIKRTMGWMHDGNRQFTGFHIHATAQDIQQKMPDELFDSYFKFIFVRNPFDFMLSVYYHIMQSEDHEEHALVQKMTFDDFVSHYIKNQQPRQSDFFMNQKGEVLVDYIGKFETLRQNVDELQNELDIQSKIPLPHINASKLRKTRVLREEYSEKSRLRVLDYFSDTFELLQYPKTL